MTVMSVVPWATVLWIAAVAAAAALGWMSGPVLDSVVHAHGGRLRSGPGAHTRVPLVPSASAAMFAVVLAWALLASRGVLQFVAFLALAAVSVALAFIDIDTHRLPNRIVLPGYAVGAVLLTCAALEARDPVALGRAAIGMVAVGGAYLALALCFTGALGFGDVKLAGLLGMFGGNLGWAELVVGTVGGFVLGGVYASFLVLVRGRSRSAAIPFGPWMLAGAWAGILFGGPLARAYLSMMGLVP